MIDFKLCINNIIKVIKRIFYKENKPFSFVDEIKELGFEHYNHKNNFMVFKYIEISSIFLFFNTNSNDVSLYKDKILLTKINFVPNNRLFIEILIKKTIENTQNG